MGIHAVGIEIVGRIDEDLIDRIDTDILFRHIFQIDVIDLGRIFDIQTHAGHSRHKIDRQRRIILKFMKEAGLAI